MDIVHTYDTTKPVLVVEDDAVITLELESILLDLGFGDVVVCMSYDNAKTQLASKPYGLVVFDIQIGGHLTFGLITEAVKRGFPVISISGYLPEAQKIRHTTFLPKPIDAARLPQAIAEAQFNAAKKR